jgi:hypothetical protein
VDWVFKLGLDYDHGLDTIVAAVKLGDVFVRGEDAISPQTKPGFVTEIGDYYYVTEDHLNYLPITKRVNYALGTLRDTPIQRMYSKELVFVVTLITGKLFEDEGCNSTKGVIEDEIGNPYILLLEWFVMDTVGYHVDRNNFVSLIGILADKPLHSDFNDICRKVCYHENLLTMNPCTVVFGLILLYKNGKLKPEGRKWNNLWINTILDWFELD